MKANYWAWPICVFLIVVFETIVPSPDRAILKQIASSLHSISISLEQMECKTPVKDRLHVSGK